MEWLPDPLGSPKFQIQCEEAVSYTTDWSVNKVGLPAHTGEVVKSAVGLLKMRTGLISESTHPRLFTTVSLTSYSPAVPYLCVGSCIVEPFSTPDPGSPKSQVQDMICSPLFRDLSWKKVGVFRQAELLVNRASGAVWTVT